jgi:membrane-bound metal-dependent hydrolase YbcI (DUF457 family)
MALRALSAALYRVTKGPRDEEVTGKHRHATHTGLFAAVLGALCAASSEAWGAAAVAVWLGVGLLLAYDRLGVLVVIPLAVGGVAWVLDVDGRVDGAAAALEQCAGWLGIAVAAGAFVHCLGDALTESGCPFLFPIPIAGETWYELRPPAMLRFQTGKRFERWVMFPVLVAGCVAAAPGAWLHIVGFGQWLATR